jgi:outer membrane protein assembly factor BamB
VDGHRTTTCCSALALIAASSLAFSTQNIAPPVFPVPNSSPLAVKPASRSLFPTVVRWTLPLNSLLSSSPGYDAERAYFPIDGGRLAAYRIANGARAWIMVIRPVMEPVAGDGLVFIVEADRLTALGAADAAVVWQWPLSVKLAVHPVWDNGWLIVATAKGTILAFRAIDGHLVWQRDLPSPAHALPALAANRVLVPTEDARVVALQVDTGAVLWERRLGGPPNDILALDERIYVGSTDHFFYCLEPKSGRIEWRWRTGGDVIGAPVADEDTVYFVSLDNVLRALARKSGVQRWLRALPIRPVAGLVNANGTILVTGLAPNVRGYNAKDGTPAGEVQTTGEIAASPHVVAGTAGTAPGLVVITRDIATGASVMLVARSIEPAIQPLAPLPNPIVTPKTPAWFVAK